MFTHLPDPDCLTCGGAGELFAGYYTGDGGQYEPCNCLEVRKEA